MPKKKIKVAFRLDDPSAASPIKIEQSLIQLFSKHNAICTFGVIPYVTNGNFRDPGPSENLPLPPKKIQLYKEAAINRTIDIALHGFEHKTISNSIKGHTEFLDLPKKEQILKLKHGKKLLEQALDIKITTFIPPWNTYDKNTISALKECGIACLSANRYAPAGKDPDIQFVPITLELPDVKNAIDDARSSNDPDPAIIILMHPYDFESSGDDRAQFDFQLMDSLLNWLNSQEDVEIYSVSQLADETNKFDLKRYQSNQPSWLENIYQPMLRRTENSLIYHSSNTAKRIKKKQELLTLILHIVTLVIGGGIGYLVLSFSSQNTALKPTLIAVSGLILALLITRTIKQQVIYYRSFQLIMLTLGFMVSLFREFNL